MKIYYFDSRPGYIPEPLTKINFSFYLKNIQILFTSVDGKLFLVQAFYTALWPPPGVLFAVLFATQTNYCEN